MFQKDGFSKYGVSKYKINKYETEHFKSTNMFTPNTYGGALSLDFMDFYIKDNNALERYIVVGVDMLQTVQFLVYNELFFTRETACLQYSINTSG